MRLLLSRRRVRGRRRRVPGRDVEQEAPRGRRRRKRRKRLRLGLGLRLRRSLPLELEGTSACRRRRSRCRRSSLNCVPVHRARSRRLVQQRRALCRAHIAALTRRVRGHGRRRKEGRKEGQGLGAFLGERIFLGGSILAVVFVAAFVSIGALLRRAKGAGDASRLERGAESVVRLFDVLVCPQLRCELRQDAKEREKGERERRETKMRWSTQKEWRETRLEEEFSIVKRVVVKGFSPQCCSLPLFPPFSFDTPSFLPKLHKVSMPAFAALRTVSS